MPREAWFTNPVQQWQADGDPPAVAPPVPPVAAWHAGLDGDTLAYVTANGLAEKSAQEAFATAARSHREAQNFIGIPKDQLLRMPSADRPDDARAFWQKLGAPADPTGYDFTGVKPATGELDVALADSLRAAAAANNLPVPAAQAVLAAVVKHQETVAQAALDATKATLATQQAALRTAWGQNYDANLGIADRTAKALGIDVETASLLGEKVGADKVLEMFRQIGAKMGEDTFVASPNREGDVPKTLGEAQGHLAMLKADPDFGKRLLAGGAKETLEWNKAFAAAHPELMAAANA